MEALPPDARLVVTTVASVFAELNTGLIIHHLAAPGDAQSLTLVYANAAASTYTGVDLNAFIGKTLGEAFPTLNDTDLPVTYAEVSTGGHSVHLGTFWYDGDAQIGPGYYAVKAFPMPARCVGVAFENITVRKEAGASSERKQAPS